MTICCVEAILMSTHNIPYQYKKKIIRNYLKYNVCSYGIFCKGLKNEFEIAVVNELSVFQSLKFYCITSFLLARTCG